MHWTERFEKTARGLLWLALALTFVLIPLGVISYQMAQAEEKAIAADAEKEAAARLSKAKEEELNGPSRLALESMGSVMRAMDVDAAEGRFFFTNVSARSGVVCVVGTATNTSTNESTDSLPSCEAVRPYSSVQIKVMFAGANITAVCPKSGACRMSVREAP